MIQRNAIKIVDLVKRFGDITAVDGLSLEIREGEDYEFHGERGKVTQVTIRVPFLGRWFIIVDSGDGPEVSVEWRLLG